MSVEINFDMPTKYIPEYKEYITISKYFDRYLPTLYKGGEAPDFYKLFNRFDESGLPEKIESAFNLNIRSYAKNDEETFNMIKLMQFLANDHLHDSPDENRHSIVNLAIHSKKYDKYENYFEYREYYNECISILREGVNNPDNIERVTEMIAKHFTILKSRLYIYAMIDAKSETNEIKRVVEQLNLYINDVKDTQINLEPNGSVIDAFYTILLSNYIIAEATSTINDYYNNLNPDEIPSEITELVRNHFFSLQMSWEEFYKRVNRKELNLQEQETKMIWMVLLNKPNVTKDDIDSIPNTIIEEYAPKLAELWKTTYETEYISVIDWIVIIKELCFIKASKTKYFYRHIGYKGKGTPTILSAIKKEHIPDVPKYIIIKHFTLHNMMLHGQTNEIQCILDIEKQLNELEKIVLSYHDVTRMEKSFRDKYLFLRVLLERYNVGTAGNSTFGYKVNEHIQNSNSNVNIPIIRFFPEFGSSNIPFLLKLLSAADSYIKTNDENFMKLRDELIECMRDNNNVFEKAEKIHCYLKCLPLPSNYLAAVLAEKLVSIYENSKLYKYVKIQTRTIGIPITLEEDMKYILYVRFYISTKTHICSYDYLNTYVQMI